MKSHLKIKIKSLATEARYIRKEERRALKAGRWANANQKRSEAEKLYSEYHSLNAHRRGLVRTEARLSHLAYAFMRKRPYPKIEPAGSAPFDVIKVAAMARRFGDPEATDKAVMSWWLTPDLGGDRLIIDDPQAV